MQLASAAFSAVGSIVQARQQKAMYDAQAAQARIAGRMKATEYKMQAAAALQNLNETLAATVARGAVGQDPLSGSAMSLQNYAFREGISETAQAKDNAVMAVENANYQASIYRQAGKNAMTVGYINAAGAMAGGYAKQNEVGFPDWASSLKIG